MDSYKEPIDSARARGQTLAEFALTLPILLLLLFGIIEFGRLFQSWVTIQNASRAAARYAVTGQFDENRYSLDMIPCTDGARKPRSRNL
jgi:Flp pilus assembly protein TadG